MKTHGHIIILFLAMSLLSLSSCRAVKEAELPQEVYYKTLKNGAMYGGGEEGLNAGFIAIRSREDWENLVKQMNKINEHVDISIADEVDFEQDMIIALIDQLRGSGGYTFSTESIIREGDQLSIYLLSKAPEGSSTSVMTQPYELIKTRKTDLTIVLISQ